MNCIMENCSDELIMQCHILLADREKNELIELLLANSRADEAPEMVEILISSSCADSLHHLRFDIVQIDACAVLLLR